MNTPLQPITVYVNGIHWSEVENEDGQQLENQETAKAAVAAVKNIVEWYETWKTNAIDNHLSEMHRQERLKAEKVQTAV